jgi:hypothetical protein
MKRFIGTMIVGLSLLAPGCASTRVVQTHGGCDARITKPAKRAACHACVSRGPRFAYEPGRMAGQRCVRH